METREWWQIETEDHGWRLETKDKKRRHIWRLRKPGEKYYDEEKGKTIYPRLYKYVGRID